MNSDTLKGQVRQLTGKARQEWGRLSDDDWALIEGRFERLAGTVQERYGIARETAEEQIRSFMSRIESEAPPTRKPRPMPSRERSQATARERAAAGL